LRTIVVIICLLMIVIRAIWSNLKFDNISLIIFTLGLIVLLLPQFRDFISRIRKFRFGDFEVELGEKLKDLAAKTEKVEANVPDISMEQTTYKGISDEIENKIIQASNDPRAALMIVAIEIEKKVRSIADKAEIPEARRPYPINRIINSLAQKEIINSEVVLIFSDFWNIRNQVVHGYHLDLSPGKLYELIEIGIRILKLLSIEKQSPEVTKE
jgi:uncharacterized protein YutE (UPF0331/DUF86 family)